MDALVDGRLSMDGCVSMDGQVDVVRMDELTLTQGNWKCQEILWGSCCATQRLLFYAIMHQTLNSLRYRIQEAARNTNQENFPTFQLPGEMQSRRQRFFLWEISWNFNLDFLWMDCHVKIKIQFRRQNFFWEISIWIFLETEFFHTWGIFYDKEFWDRVWWREMK